MPESNKIFASVISDGSIRVKVEEGTPGAVRRDYETPKGEKGFKWEQVYSSIDGVITGIEFKDTDFGQFIDINVKCDSGNVVLGLSVDNSFSQDLMKKLPNVDFNQQVRLAPYSMDTKDGKSLKGVTIYQNKEKLKSYFYNFDTKTNINGFPEIEKGKTYTKDDWKIYFIQVKQFLINFIKSNVITRINPDAQITVDDGEEVIQVEEINVEEIDFNEPDKKQEEDLDEVIKGLIYEKCGISKMEEVKVKAMELSGIAYIPSNRSKIIESLKNLK